MILTPVLTFALAAAPVLNQPPGPLSKGAGMPSGLSGAGSVAQPRIKVVELEVKPRGEPDPALRYRLMPSAAELRRGNAVVYYLRALQLLGQIRYLENEEQLSKWAYGPLDQLPVAEAREFCSPEIMREVDSGARCRDCDWQNESRFDQGELFPLLNEIQNMRRLALIVSLKVRCDVAEKKFADAVATLQSGFAMARHTARGPTAVQGLVGIAIAGILHGRLEELIQQPEAPNLYWAMATLPRPFVDLRPVLESETLLLDSLVADLGKLEGRVLSVEQANRMVVGIQERLAEIGGGAPDLPGLFEVPAMGLVLASYARARQQLLDEGMDAERVEQMPTAQVVLLASTRRLYRSQQAYFKWVYLPYPDARRALSEASRQLVEEIRSGPGLDVQMVLLRLLTPALNKLLGAGNRIDRWVAGLQAVEAVAMQVAEDGKLPERLTDVTVVPVPPDPLTLAPFPYEVRGDIAVLTLPTPEGEEPNLGNTRQYRIKFRKP